MSTLGKITRRAFLVGSVAVAGGVAFGVYQVTKAVPNPLHPEDGTALNPFLIIDASGVTIVTGRAEMGQGAQVTLAACLAEELDVDWESVRLLHGPASAAYYNGALLEGALPGPDYARPDWQRSIAETMGVVARPLKLQFTGGSTSIRDGYNRLRQVGASAREVLKAAAADRLGVAAATLRTESGAVIAPDGTRLPYADLAEAAARLDPPQVDPRPASEWRLLGTALPRPDIPAKVNGTAQFGIDTRLPGMKFASVKRSPRLGGTMQGFDPAPALAIPGVERVIDIGDGVAVVARNTWAAIQGAQAVTCDWGPAPYPADDAGITERLLAAFDGSADSTMRDDGDADSANGETVIEAEYRLPYLAHATMEPMNATALFDGNTLELWSPNQGPFIQARAAAEAAGIDAADVTVHTAFLGGGFGRRIEADYAAIAARVARAMPGTPVNVTWSREEDMTHDFYRPAAIARMKGAVSNGQAVLFDARIASPALMGPAGSRMTGLPMAGPDRSIVEGGFDQPYAIPNYRVRGYKADLAVPVGFWRSVGSSHNGFSHESFIDELAHAAGQDPLAFRLVLARGESAAAAGVLEAVRDMSGWDRPKAPGTGRGVAMVWSFGTPVAQVIEVRDEGGAIRVARAWIAADVGIPLDPGILAAQMEGGMLYGLSAAIHGRISFADGRVQQQNFPDYDALRISGAPVTEVRLLSNNPHIGGAGEPGTPPAAPALTNALFDLTGVRARELPLERQFTFVL
ncbi:MAG: xanthine dehydrogenase family protein molybdopterin-binding subunit [Rhodobacter sp.]|nr:xanthine dehydrogenase family protein molybdopterin-binding subunit [Paracoccaceae bacterium]MCC0076131.1 xanthine dehydrogenase family protein molybdopterin-binding subunit [Rhodobacter sp.]